jgi:putative transposase
MSSKYKFVDGEAIYFVTATVVGWAEVFTRTIYREILLDSFRFCQQNQGLQIHAWVLMPNHFHMICSFKDANPGMVLKNIKSFTALKLIDAIINNPQESRKEWLLNLFEEYGQQNKSNHRFQFWQTENQPILLDNAAKYLQRLTYLHENPVRAGFVSAPEHWLYSSAINYCELGKGLLDLIILE